MFISPSETRNQATLCVGSRTSHLEKKNNALIYVVVTLPEVHMYSIYGFYLYSLVIQLLPTLTTHAPTTYMHTCV